MPEASEWFAVNEKRVVARAPLPPLEFRAPRDTSGDAAALASAIADCGFVPSDDQLAGVQVAWDKLNGGAGVVVGTGRAGSGKTTVARILAAAWRNSGRQVLVAAPTWKAAARLKEAAGLAAVSLHSVVYMGPTVDAPTAAQITGGMAIRAAMDGLVLEELDEAARLTLRAEVAAEMDTGGELRFDKIRKYDPEIGADQFLLLVDEASMPDAPIVRDFHEAAPGAQILALGDPEQLPPVKGLPGFDLSTPDFELRQIHRQDVGGVLTLITRIWQERLLGERILSAARDAGLPTWPKVPVESIAQALADVVAGRESATPGAEVAICTTNRMRVVLNTLVRAHLGMPSPRTSGPQRGERVVVLDTNHEAQLCKGEAATVLLSEPGPQLGKVPTYRVVLWLGGERQHEVFVPTSKWAEHDLDHAKTTKRLRDSGALRGLGVVGGLGRRLAEGVKVASEQRAAALLVGLTPGYAITCHSAQGSQWDAGIVIAEWARWLEDDEYRLWYTACSRFARTLTVATCRFDRRHAW